MSGEKLELQQQRETVNPEFYLTGFPLCAKED